jgi:hypothetical protein
VITGPQDENNVFDPEDLEINDESYNNANVMVSVRVGGITIATRK